MGFGSEPKGLAGQACPSVQKTTGKAVGITISRIPKGTEAIKIGLFLDSNKERHSVVYFKMKG